VQRRSISNEVSWQGNHWIYIQYSQFRAISLLGKLFMHQPSNLWPHDCKQNIAQ
jgi:hypothetical protein